MSLGFCLIAAFVRPPPLGERQNKPGHHETLATLLSRELWLRLTQVIQRSKKKFHEAGSGTDRGW
jgi:hypothetical protein